MPTTSIIDDSIETKNEEGIELGGQMNGIRERVRMMIFNYEKCIKRLAFKLKLIEEENQTLKQANQWRLDSSSYGIMDEEEDN
jgi:hypothetical protein